VTKGIKRFFKKTWVKTPCPKQRSSDEIWCNEFSESVFIDAKLQIRQQIRGILNFIENNGIIIKAIEKSVGICFGKGPLQRIIKTDIRKLFTRFMLKKSRLPGLVQ